MKPICVPCQRFYRPLKNGFAFIEAMPNGSRVIPGKAMPERWEPYKLWMGDKWICPDCHAEIIVGVGRDPVSEHYHPEFAECVARFAAILQVNDC